MNRRQFVQRTVLASVGLATARLSSESHAVDFAKPAPEAQGVTAYQRDGGIQFRKDNLPLLAYRAQHSLKYPYFYPLNGPVSGLSLTAESALPYPHHRGLWLGCDPLNGGNYWADNGLESGQIRSTHLGLDVGSATKTSASFVEKCVWTRKGSQPVSDDRRYTVTVPDDEHVFIDCWFRLTANQDISIKRAKHSFFAMRAAADISPTYGGTLINSNGGKNAAGTYAKTANWCGYYGKRRLRPDVVEGIVIMNHPDNFGGRCPWFTREYGHLSPSPFNFLSEPWTLEKGQTLVLSYRVVLFSRDPQQAGLDAIFTSWMDS